MSDLNTNENRALSKEACKVAAQWWADQICKEDDFCEGHQQNPDKGMLTASFFKADIAAETVVTDAQREKFVDTLASSLEEMDIAGKSFGTNYDAHPAIEDALHAARLPGGSSCLPAKTLMTIELNGEIKIGYPGGSETLNYKTTENNSSLNNKKTTLKSGL